MDLNKEYKRIGQGITSSSSKRKVLHERLDVFVKSIKKYWYKKLILKLESIKNNEISIEDYVEEVNQKINT